MYKYIHINRRDLNLTVAIQMCLQTGYSDYISQTHLSIF
jgi:hypothetical protein